MSGTLSEWSEVIRQQGEEHRKRNDRLRKRIKEQGSPFRVIIPNLDELETELRFWKFKGGVVVIEFRDGKANLNYIRQYTDEFIDAISHTKSAG